MNFFISSPFTISQSKHSFHIFHVVDIAVLNFNFFHLTVHIYNFSVISQKDEKKPLKSHHFISSTNKIELGEQSEIETSKGEALIVIKYSFILQINKLLYRYLENS